MSDIIISTPTGIFEVEIKDSDNNTVYGPTTQTNAAFDPGITTPGDYVVYITFDGNTNGFCWHISGCQCPIPTQAIIIQEGVIRSIEFTFDIPDLDEFCPFAIRLIYSGGSAGVDYAVYITDISQLDFVSGTTYTKTIPLTYSMTATSVTYGTYQLISGTEFVENPCMPDLETVQFECIAPKTNSIYPNFGIVENGGDYYLRLSFQSLCDTKTCDQFTVNYLQTFPATVSPLDSGSYTFTADCSDFPAVTQMDFLINPNTSLFDSTRGVAYRITLINCCSTTVLNNVQIGCSGPLQPNVSANFEIVKIASAYFMRITYLDCGLNCHSYNAGTLLQILDSGSGGNIETIPSSTLDCNDTFPYSIDIPLNPLPSTTIKYRVGAVTCCGSQFNNLVTYVP